MKILLDTNIFVIDRFFPRDERFAINKRFLDTISIYSPCFSIFSLFELLGMASFNLSESELTRWFYEFGEIYTVEVLSPKLVGLAETWFEDFSENLFKQIQKKATLGDAFILMEANDYDIDCIVTWNKKDFLNRFAGETLTPMEFINQYLPDESTTGNKTDTINDD